MDSSLLQWGWFYLCGIKYYIDDKCCKLHQGAFCYLLCFETKHVWFQPFQVR